MSDALPQANPTGARKQGDEGAKVPRNDWWTSQQYLNIGRYKNVMDDTLDFY
jgi:hypothetical protein